MDQNRLIYYTNPPTLPELTSVIVAIDLWYHEIIVRWSANKTKPLCEIFATFNAEKIPLVPARVRKMIENHIDPIRKEIESWITYQRDRVLIDESINAIEFLIEFFDHIVWFPTGIIDYESTAKNMLRWDRLSETEKYSVACTYCIKEDIVKLRQLQEGFLRCDNITFIQHSLLHYWEYRLVDRIPAIPNDVPDFLETSIMDWPAVDNWPAIRYFWNHLDDTDRVRQAIRIIARYNDARFTKDILAKLTESELHHVVAQIGSVMMLRMINNSKLAQYTYQTWLHVRHILNKYQFFEIIRGIFNTKIRYTADIPRDEILLRIKIWSSANDHQKQTALIDLINERTPFEYRGTLKNLPRDMHFLITILAAASFEQRNFVWRHNWSDLIYGTKPQFIEQLMKICLEHPEDVILFKEQVLMEFTRIKKYCFELAEERLFTELNNFLKFCCSSDAQKILTLKQQILQSCFLDENIKFNYHLLRDLHKLDEFINDVFRDDNLAKNFKKKIVLLPSNVEFIEYVIQNGDLYLVKNLFDLFLSSEPDLRWSKSHFLDLCRNALSGNNFWKFETREWQDFIDWCAGSVHRVRDFKRSIRLDEVFDTVISRCFEFQSHTHSCNVYAKCDNDNRLYTLLNDFLWWYFSNADSIRSYKLNKIYGYQDVDILKRIFTEGGECIIQDMLEWFFNGNVEEIENFKAHFRNDLGRNSLQVN